MGAHRLPSSRRGPGSPEEVRKRGVIGRVNLDGRLGAGLQNVESVGLVGEGVEPLDVDGAGGELRGSDDLAQVLHIALNARDARGGQRLGELLQRLGAGSSLGDNLGKG